MLEHGCDAGGAGMSTVVVRMMFFFFFRYCEHSNLSIIHRVIFRVVLHLWANT